MPTGVVKTYDGFGNYTGFTRMREYSLGEAIAGVKSREVPHRGEFSGGSHRGFAGWPGTSREI